MKPEQVYQVNQMIERGSPKLWAFVKSLIDDCVARGLFDYEEERHELADARSESQAAAKEAGDGMGAFANWRQDAEGFPRVYRHHVHDVTDAHIGRVFSDHNKAAHLAANGRFQVYVWHSTKGTSS